ncbi:UNVERIFIED_CONTAM: hypothetical protein Sindi_0056500 [Sesamum indicum]
MSQLYVVLDRQIRHAVTKAFFGAKMIEGSFVQEHGVKMLALLEKLKDLKADLEKVTYIDYKATIEKSASLALGKGGFDLRSERQRGRTLKEKEGKTESATASAQSSPVA